MYRNAAKRLNKASNVIEAQKPYAAKKVEVPGLAYRNADPLEFSECASIASPRRPCLSVRSTRVWPQGRQSAAQAHEGKIPQGLRFCMPVPELRTFIDNVDVAYIFLFATSAVQTISRSSPQSFWLEGNFCSLPV